MDLDDSRIRRLVLAACPQIEAWRLEVSEINYGDLMGFWHRKGDGTVHKGHVLAIKRTEAEVAADIASELLSEGARVEIDAIVAAHNATFQPSPYEGKRGKHPKSCTCSKHLKAASGETQ